MQWFKREFANFAFRNMVVLKFLLLSFIALIGSVSAYRVVRDNVPVAEKSGSMSTNNALPHDKLKTLRLVTLVLRHGNRYPQDTYPNDPYVNETYEPFGWGQLTLKGRKNQYNQGQFLRERYDKFLGSEYEPDKFWLQSTETDRTKMSALLEAAAIWKPNNRQKFKQDLPWQPVVLNYQNRKDDTLLLIWSTCPDYARMRSLAMNSTEIQKLDSENEKFYKELTDITGKKVTNADDVFDIYGTLYAQNDVGLELPSWTKNLYPDKFLEASVKSFELNGYNDEMKRQKYGPLVTKIVNDMNAKSEGKLEPGKRKMLMYVGHDSTIVAALSGFNVWDNRIPGYNIMMMIELHQDKDAWKVEMYVKNSTESSPVPLTMPGCEFSCPLEKFNQLIEPMIVTPEEWRKECKLKDANFTEQEAPPP